PLERLVMLRGQRVVQRKEDGARPEERLVIRLKLVWELSDYLVSTLRLGAWPGEERFHSGSDFVYQSVLVDDALCRLAVHQVRQDVGNALGINVRVQAVEMVGQLLHLCFQTSQLSFFHDSSLRFATADFPHVP